MRLWLSVAVTVNGGVCSISLQGGCEEVRLWGWCDGDRLNGCGIRWGRVWGRGGVGSGKTICIVMYAAGPVLDREVIHC